MSNHLSHLLHFLDAYEHAGGQLATAIKGLRLNLDETTTEGPLFIRFLRIIDLAEPVDSVNPKLRQLIQGLHDDLEKL